MTFPFWCLLMVASLPWVWVIVADFQRKKQFGRIDNDLPRAQSARLEGAGARAHAAEQNAWEALPVFAVCVFIAHLVGADPEASSIACGVFVAARVVHGLVYIAGLSTLRSSSFLVGVGCCIWLAVLAGTT